MTPTSVIARLRQLANDWRHEEKWLCEQFGDAILPQSMRARQIKDTQAIDAAVEMIERMEKMQVANIREQLESAEKERDRYKLAYNDWIAKTEWLQHEIACSSLPAKYLGMHRADAIKLEIDRLRAKIEEMENQEPVKYEFQDREGKWHPFIDQKHYENTVADGSWAIRGLYTLPGAKGE